MGTIKSGILGGFSGNVGNVVGSSWKGVDYMKSLPTSVHNPRTPLQVAQRLKMKTIVLMAQLILSSSIKKLWNGAAVKMSGFNAFVKANIGAISSTGVVDASKIVASTGPMASTPITSATYTLGTKTVAVVFPVIVDLELQSANDIAHLLVIDVTGKKAFATSGALRSSGAISIVLPADMAVNALTSFAFLSFKGNEPLVRQITVSDSSSKAIV